MGLEFLNSNAQKIAERRASLESELDRICEVVEGFALPLRYLLRFLLFVITTCVALLAAAALRLYGLRDSPRAQIPGSESFSKEQYDKGFALAHLLLLPRQGLKDSVFFFVSVFEIVGARIVRPGELRFLSKAPNQLLKQVAFLFWRVFSLVLKAAHLLPHIVPGTIVRAVTRLLVLLSLTVLFFFSAFVSALLNGVSALLQFHFLSLIFTIGSACAMLVAFLVACLALRQMVAVSRALMLFVRDVSQEVSLAVESNRDLP